MTKTEEFVYINRLAWRLLRFKCNRLINTIMKKTKAERISQQVWGTDGVGKYDKLREIRKSEGVSIGDARRILAKRERAERKRQRVAAEVEAKVERLKAKKGW